MLISTTQHMIHLQYCLCSDIVMHLSFFPKLFHLQPHNHLPQLNLSLFLYWKYSIVILYMHILSKISHTFKPNQTPNVASSVGYIISCMSQPFCRVLRSCTGTQMLKTFIRNASLELISHHLPWSNSELNSTWLCKQNHSWPNLSGHCKTWCWHFFSS